MRSPVHGRPLLVGLLSTALAVSVSALAGPPLAAASPSSPAAEADPGGTPPLKDAAQADTLGPQDRELLAEAVDRGKKRVNLMVVTTEGETDAVVSDLESLGGAVINRFDKAGYLSVRIPTRSVTKAAGLSDVEAVDLDQVVENPSPNPSTRRAAAAAAQQGPGADTPNSNPFMPTRDTGAVAFKSQFPASDGRGITIGIMDSGVDLDHPALAETTTGDRKIVDWVTATSPYEDLSWRFMLTDVNGPTFDYLEQTWTTPDEDPEHAYQVNSFAEDITEGSEPAGDVNRDGDTTDVFGVLYDPETHEVWVDVDQDLDFGDEEPMLPYNEDYQVNHFGTDDESTEVVERSPFVVEYREDVDTAPLELEEDVPAKADVVSIGLVEDAHGSHVAGITAANSMFGGAMDGAAPGAQLVSSRACTWGGGCTVVALTDGMADLVLNRGVDVVNMSIGGLGALNDGNDTDELLYDRLIDLTGVQLFLAAGNEGPGVNTAGSPASADSVISVASSITKETWKSNYGATVSSAENLHNYSSRGPREDGGFKPDLMAPGAAVSTVPQWLKQPDIAEAGYTLPIGYAMFNGTSMASPQAAGAAALLLSRARQRDIAVTPKRLQDSLFSTARFRGGIPAAAQGRGQINLVSAWSLLVREPSTTRYTVDSPVCTELDDFLLTPGRGEGLYNRCAPGRGGQTPGSSRTYPVKITRLDGPSRTVVHQLRLVGNDGTFSVPREVRLPRGRAVTVNVRSRPGAAGLHSAILRIDRPGTPVIDHHVPLNVVATSSLSRPSYSTTQNGSVERGLAKSLFVSVPAGTTALQVDLAGVAYDSLFLFTATDPYGIPVDTACTTNATNPTPCDPYSRAYQNPLPGVWEITVQGARTTNSLRNPYRLTAVVQGVTVEPERVTLPSVVAGEATPVEWDVTNTFGPVRVHGEGGPLGSSFTDRPTIAEGATQEFEVTVPEGASSLDVAIGNPADVAADLDLTVLLGGEQVAQQADGDSDEAVSIPDPDPGTYTVVVDGYSVPTGSTEYDYLDVYFSPGLGQLVVDPTATTLANGATTTIEGAVTATEPPVEGRELFGRMTVLSDQDAVPGTGSVVIEEVTEPTPAPAPSQG